MDDGPSMADREEQWMIEPSRADQEEQWMIGPSCARSGRAVAELWPRWPNAVVACRPAGPPPQRRPHRQRPSHTTAPPTFLDDSHIQLPLPGELD